MGFVFYDTETTGISTSFDQILQFAAICTDADLEEVDRIDLRCRLLPHVLPHPAALRITGMRYDQVADPARLSHYDMIRAVRGKLLEWSPAIFVGYNSLTFDEHLLRQALFQTLHPPFLTNTGGNGRADALALVQIASIFVPTCLTVPCNDKGMSVFKLEHLAPVNGFAHANAHDALADVEATIHLARCVVEKAPECWNRFVRFASKAAASAFIDEEDAFLLTEFYYGRPYQFVVTAFSRDPGRDAIALCLDLKHDPTWLTTLAQDQLIKLVARSPKPVRRVRLNAAPGLAALDEVEDHMLAPLTRAEIDQRVALLRADVGLCSRLSAAVAYARPVQAPSEHFEEQIYDEFSSPADNQRMERFHLLSWEARSEVVESFEDARLHHFGRRLLYERDPTLLEPAHRAEIESLIEARWRAGSDRTTKWTTLQTAHDAIVEMLAAGGPDIQVQMGSYRDYLAARLT